VRGFPEAVQPKARAAPQSGAGKKSQKPQKAKKNPEGIAETAESTVAVKRLEDQSKIGSSSTDKQEGSNNRAQPAKTKLGLQIYSKTQEKMTAEFRPSRN